MDETQRQVIEGSLMMLRQHREAVRGWIAEIERRAGEGASGPDPQLEGLKEAEAKTVDLIQSHERLLGAS